MHKIYNSFIEYGNKYVTQQIIIPKFGFNVNLAISVRLFFVKFKDGVSDYTCWRGLKPIMLNISVCKSYIFKQSYR